MPTNIYRIVHRENLNLILGNKKIFAPNYGKSSKYIPIGETELIIERANLQIFKKPGGTIKDYVAFYFGIRSPMLYCIKNGFDVTRKPQNEIIYLVSSMEKLLEFKRKFVFTDGHAFAAFTMFFNNVKDIDQIDWNAVNLVRWNNTETDPDRKRRKQAECFVYKDIPLEAISEIVVYNQECFDYISKVLKKHKTKLPTRIEPSWYY